MSKYDKSWNFEEKNVWKTIGIGFLNVCCLASIFGIVIVIYVLACIPK